MDRDDGVVLVAVMARAASAQSSGKADGYSRCSDRKCGGCGSDSDCKGHGRCSDGKCGGCGSDSDCSGAFSTFGPFELQDDGTVVLAPWAAELVRPANACSATAPAVPRPSDRAC